MQPDIGCRRGCHSSCGFVICRPRSHAGLSWLAFRRQISSLDSRSMIFTSPRNIYSQFLDTTTESLEIREIAGPKVGDILLLSTPPMSYDHPRKYLGARDYHFCRGGAARINTPRHTGIDAWSRLILNAPNPKKNFYGNGDSSH